MMEPAAAGRGLKVRKVLPGSNAERAGLRQGDLLLALDGENLASNLDLIYALKQKHPGDHGVLQVVREGGQPKSLEVIFQTSAGN
jgi:S1-C subfamily serine protease